jgi:hypothetical protein
MVPFYTRFRELALNEMRSATVRGRSDLPDGEYGFLELYCDDPDCDCRRVIINVVTPTGPETLATINYGWENIEFYTQWMHGDKILARGMQGATLDILNPQSRHADALLNLFEWVLEDQAYVERLKKHYALFKSSLRQQRPLDARRRARIERRRRKRD